MRIAIVGYGTAGQAAAILLGRQGCVVDVFEQSAELRPVGAGFLLQPTGLGVLKALALDEMALAVGSRVERLFGATADGRIVMDMRYRDHAVDCHGLGMTRNALFELLHTAASGCVDIHLGRRIVAIADGGRRLVADDGEHHGGYDLTVVADGAHSRLRADSGLAGRDALYPWGALWCLLPAPGWPWPDQLQQRYAGTQAMVGVLPVGRRGAADGSGDWLTFYYSAPAHVVDAFDDNGLAAMKQAVAGLFPELSPRVDALGSAGELKRARYRDVVVWRSWADRVVMIGDAAHAMSPQLGQGVNMALLDAQALATALASESRIEAALDAYARTRASHVGVYQFMSRWLTPLFQSDRAGLGWCRDLAFGPLSRLPLLRQQALGILTGTRRGWWR